MSEAATAATTMTTVSTRTRPPARVAAATAAAAASTLIFRPILATVISTRKAAVALAVLAVAQVAATSLHLPGWPCPFFKSTGIPCPGCGLSRACTALLHGDAEHSLHLHAFAAPVLLGILFVLATALLPAPLRTKMLAAVERLERRTGLTSLLLIAMFVYWIARLLYAPHAFISLVAHP